MPLPNGLVNWSFSVLEMFENCEYKYWAVKVGKIVSDDNQYNIDGDDEHKTFANYLTKRTPLPPRCQIYQPILDKVLSSPGQLYVEYNMTLDYNYVPCKGTDWDRAWVRGAADVLIVDGGLATYIDWKTGKFRPKEAQLKLTAPLVFRHFPAVQEFRGVLFFHREQRMTDPLVIARSEENDMWNQFLPTVNAIAKARSTGEYRKKPNPLCAYCPVKSCEHWKPSPPKR